MKLSLPTLLAPLALSAFAGASNSFGGSSLYFLHGLSSSDQDYYINTLSGYGAKVIRLWITGLGTGCVKGSNVATDVPDFETTIGTYNNATLEAIDGVLSKMAAKGMKAIISPHDGNDIHDSSTSGNGCDAYCKTYATSFYTSSTAQAQYDARIQAILSYVSPSSGKAWGAWSEAILAFDLENEPFQFTSDASDGDPANWLCGRAANFKKYITDPNIKVATGGIGGDQSHGYNMLPKALQCSSIDLMSVHAYVGSASSWSNLLPKFESSCASNNKLVYVEEWGVSTSYPSDFSDQITSLNAQDIPWVYWQFIPGDDATESCTDGCCSSYDGFEIGLTSGKGNVQAAVSAAEGSTAKQDWGFAGFSGSNGSPVNGSSASPTSVSSPSGSSSSGSSPSGSATSGSAYGTSGGGSSGSGGSGSGTPTSGSSGSEGSGGSGSGMPTSGSPGSSGWGYQTRKGGHHRYKSHHHDSGYATPTNGGSTFVTSAQSAATIVISVTCV
ncbi:hypothetical protein B7494_g2360 [Chlorociboria aeruginascens]|nr:hypothetical protein B7494_g2360 [Chlorociboria aeruginascens]